MEGYHGTTPKNAAEILSSKSINFKPFKITHDGGLIKGQTLPNDLGQGLYLFIDDQDRAFIGYNSAKKYAENYRSENKQIKILKIEVLDEGANALDLNNNDNIRILNTLKEKLYQRVDSQLNNLKINPTLRRSNLDGIFIEFLIKFNLSDSIDFVICDTYTSVENSIGSRTISNIPNGKELCLRNLNLIDWEKVKECD